MRSHRVSQIKCTVSGVITAKARRTGRKMSLPLPPPSDSLWLNNVASSVLKKREEQTHPSPELQNQFVKKVSVTRGIKEISSLLKANKRAPPASCIFLPEMRRGERGNQEFVAHITSSFCRRWPDRRHCLQFFRPPPGQFPLLRGDLLSIW